MKVSAGGHEGAGTFDGETFVLDIVDLTWTRICPDIDSGLEKKPTARGWAAMAVWGKDRFFLYGGLDCNANRLGDAWELNVSRL